MCSSDLRENLSLVEARLGKARDAEQDHDLASQWRRNAELSGVDPRSLPRDPVTEALWPGGARVGAPSPAVLASLGVEDYGTLYKFTYELRFNREGYPFEVYDGLNV